MTLSDVLTWLEREPVELDGRVYVFPHGAHVVKRFLKDKDTPKKQSFRDSPCPDCGSPRYYSPKDDKCFESFCGRNVGGFKSKLKELHR